MSAVANEKLGKAESKRQGDADDTVQVLNLSFPRCGTMSIQAALNQLGYKCWHSTTCFGDNVQCRRWLAAQDAKFLRKGTPFKRSDWDKIFRGYTAVSADPPATGFAEDLAAAYPNAKIILVERDEDSWFESMNATTIESMFKWDLNAVASIDPWLIGPVRDMQRHWVASWWGVKSRDEMRIMARSKYREHNRSIRSVIPADRLLDFRLKDGWEPLCQFLGKDVPDAPFPTVHDRSQVEARRKWIWMRGLQIVGSAALTILVPFFGGLLAWWLWKAN